ncbi:MAG: tail length tape measure protein [Rhodovulum sulfidophilum]|uniref:Tail length tape measure protein n=1 Tax=Rhodovulum sulfidophilum TaxID=35806 RepID=A0A2W5QC66_RHOSU|nr:MAG: tail length tape measure protein [Rhodovulum sulfidophilum]
MAMLRRALLTLLIGLAGPSTCAPAAAEDDPDAALCEAAIVNGARRGGVPPEVLLGVALTETGRKSNGRIRPYPWAINREGKGYWFKSRDEAIAFARDSLAAGRRSFDVGCVQINYRWHGHAFPSLEDMFDPEWTATYAAQFLRTLYEERGSWSEAAGAYHSLTPDLAAIYRQRFDRLLADLGPGDLPDAETLVARATPDARRSSRSARREAQRRALAEQIARAGPPLPAAPGSVARVPAGAPGGALLAPGTGPLLTEGRPMLAETGPPLMEPAGGGLY